MGKIKQGILGNVSGKVGNVIGGSWKGIGTVRIVPSSVSNPQTAGQVEQRSRMSGAVLFAQSILSTWIKPLFDRFAVKQSGFNAWIQANIALFIGGVLTTPSNLIMSIGNMSSTLISSLSVDATKKIISVAWIPDSVGFHLSSDVAYAFIYNATQDVIGVHSGTIRSSGEINVTFVEPVVYADDLHLFLVFKRANGLYVSLASYINYSVL
jgi:hypothetical protein